jgi:uncharacterized membrane protein YesL
MTRSTSLLLCSIVIHYQQKKGNLLKLSLFIELMCFLRIQNLELKPPYRNLVMSLSLQLALDFWCLNSNYLSMFSSCCSSLPLDPSAFSLARSFVFIFLLFIFLFMIINSVSSSDSFIVAKNCYIEEPSLSRL